MSDAEQFAADVMATVLAHEGKYLVDYAKPMGAFVVRFSGDKLGHAGKAADAALDRVLATARRPVAFRGYLTKGAKSTRHAAPKQVAAAGRKLLTTALATVKGMPADPTRLYFTDGKPDGLVPEDFAAYLSLVKDPRATFATGRGFLSGAFPLAALGDPKWLALVDELVVLLAAEVAWLGPAVWLAPHCLFNGSLNRIDSAQGCLAIWGHHPQLDIPSMFASRYPFAFDDYEPGALAGLLGPSWVMWLGAPLAKKVKRYGGATAKLHGGATRYHASAHPPFAMTEVIYAEWKARWAELAPVHVTNASEDPPAVYYRARFAAKTFAALLPDWEAAHDAATAKRARDNAISAELQRLAAAPTPALLAYADSVAKEMSAYNARAFLPGLRELLLSGVARPEEASVWLDLCDQLEDDWLLEKAAAVATAAGDHARAIDLLRRAIAAGRVQPKHLPRIAEFRPLRKHPGFAKLAR